MKNTQDSGRIIHPVDAVIAVLLLAFCAWLFYLTTSFEEVSDMFAQDITPAFFPRLLLWFIVLLTLILPFEYRLFKNGRQLDKKRMHAVDPMAYFSIALLVMLVLLLPWLGVYLSLIVVCLLLPLLWGERRWKLLLPFAAIFPTVIVLLFSQVLKVYLEPGVFGLDFR